MIANIVAEASSYKTPWFTIFICLISYLAIGFIFLGYACADSLKKNEKDPDIGDSAFIIIPLFWPAMLFVTVGMMINIKFSKYLTRYKNDKMDPGNKSK